jgi:hypothetical protein
MSSTLSSGLDAVAHVRYDAFVSCGRLAHGRLAAALRVGLQTIGTPW